MSRGIGHVERAIVEYFASASAERNRKCVDIETLAHAAYVSRHFHISSDWRPTRAQLVAVRRAVKRLQDMGYPVNPFRVERAAQGRPMIVQWTGHNRYWWRKLAETNPETARRAQRAAKEWESQREKRQDDFIRKLGEMARAGVDSELIAKLMPAVRSIR
jgi:hypothetical protein